MRAILDTNILIDFLGGIDEARTEIGLYEEPAISLISWMEVLAGARDDREEAMLRSFLTRFDIQPVTTAVAEEAVKLRRRAGIRLPDAIIWGTARVHGCILVSRNTRDFPARDPGVRVPYTLHTSGSTDDSAR